MNGSRLARSRAVRLAVYGGCGVVVLLLVFLYRAATSEMARLRDLHIQCAHQQETLAAQLQVIFEYKVRLEKSLAEEKSSNAAVRQELQQRATREKSLRDKDSIEAMQRFNSLQQIYKLLQTEHQDLREECKKREKQALEDTNRLEATLRDLRTRIRQAREDKDKALEHLKSKFLELDTQKTELEQKYKDMLRSNGTNDSIINHLKKEVFQLQRELEEAKKSSRKATSPRPSMPNPQPLQPQSPEMKSGNPGNAAQPVDPSQQQQVSPPMNDDKSPVNVAAAQQTIEDPLQSNEQRMNEVNNVRFAQENGNIVPVGPNEIKQADVLPLPYDFQENRLRKENDKSKTDRALLAGENNQMEQPKQVIPSPNKSNEKPDGKKSTPNSPGNEISVTPTKYQGGDGKSAMDSSRDRVSWLGDNGEKHKPEAGKHASDKVDEKLENAQNSVDGILNQIFRMI